MFKKRLITLSIFFIAITPYLLQAGQCPDTQYESGFKKDKPIVAVPEAIKVAGPIFPGGKVVCHISFDLESGTKNLLHRVETGKLNGVLYRFYYTDGSGSVQGLSNNELDVMKDKYDGNWNLRCKQAGISDAHYCAMSRASLLIGVTGDSSYFIHVGNDHFPGSTIALRVDKLPAVTAPADPGLSQKQQVDLLAAMNKGDSVLVRYVEWPHESNIDRAISLFGYNSALQIITEMNRIIE
ncbi:hypothetical protein FE275_08645 [Pseudomonas koreensis]|uniref:hypothetical protein n=1 Tax=Pseudomonas koreensis TaxID=198620 RepID=UPI001238BC15|nr:hypothetical protein [Pseudomonas koreensis]KAA8741340.1 hypothetical protein FE275_08645 [Pseudomonas koreensis]